MMVILNSAECSSELRRSSYPETKACVLGVELGERAVRFKEEGKQGRAPEGRQVMNSANVLHIPIVGLW
jgi:hypothetical protein